MNKRLIPFRQGDKAIFFLENSRELNDHEGKTPIFKFTLKEYTKRFNFGGGDAIAPEIKLEPIFEEEEAEEDKSDVGQSKSENDAFFFKLQYTMDKLGSFNVSAATVKDYSTVHDLKGIDVFIRSVAAWLENDGF